jgi:hypothetical protein
LLQFFLRDRVVRIDLVRREDVMNRHHRAVADVPEMLSRRWYYEADKIVHVNLEDVLKSGAARTRLG